MSHMLSVGFVIVCFLFVVVNAIIALCWPEKHLIFVSRLSGPHRYLDLGSIKKSQGLRQVRISGLVVLLGIAFAILEQVLFVPSRAHIGKSQSPIAVHRNGSMLESVGAIAIILAAGYCVIKPLILIRWVNRHSPHASWQEIGTRGVRLFCICAIAFGGFVLYVAIVNGP